MQILVTGAAGVVGSRLVARLLARGHTVRGLVLPADPAAERLAGDGLELRRGDVARRDTLAGVFDDVHTVYHLAAVLLSEDPDAFSRVNVEGTRNVIEAARAAGVEHLVHVSSASVIYPRSTPYSRSKRAAEALVRSAGMRWTIVRPTLVFEEGGGQEFLLFCDFLRRFPVVPLLGDGRARKRPVHVEDLIDGLVALAGNPRGYGQVYNLSGGDTVTMRELALLLLAQDGARKLLVPVPVPLCRLAATLLGLLLRRPHLSQHTIAGLTQHADLDPETARRDLGYHPIGIREWLATHRLSR